MGFPQKRDFQLQWNRFGVQSDGADKALDLSLHLHLKLLRSKGAF